MKPFVVSFIVIMLSPIVLVALWDKETRKKIWSVLVVSGATFLFLTLCTGCAPEYRVGTFNIRWSNDQDGPNGWTHRKETVVQTIREMDVDAIGLQEVMPDQLADLESEFNAEYQIEAFSTTVQSQAIMVRREFPIRDSSFLDLGDSFGLAIVHLEDFTFASVHAPGTRDSLVRVREALPNEETILVGDFNALPGPNPWFEEQQYIFTWDRKFRDVYAEVVPLNERKSSGCAWRNPCPALPESVDGRIDWILATSDFDPVDADILQRLTLTGGNVSDHWPVLGVVR